MCNDRSMKGCLYAVGLGPGDPALLTVAAVEILKKADRIIVPKAKVKPSTAKDILTRALGADLPFHVMTFPMTRDKDELDEQWKRNTSELREMIKRGETVVFVTLGDISLFSTFFYLERELKCQYPSFPIKKIPGISSVQLAAVRFDLPLAQGDESYCVIPLPADLNKLSSYVDLHDSVVILKVGERLGELTQWLKREGLQNQASFVRRAGFPDEHLCLSMDMLDPGEKGYLSIVMIKKDTYES